MPGCHLWIHFRQRQHPVYPNQPSLGGESFLKVLQFEVVVADCRLTDRVVALRLALPYLYLTEAVVDKLVHQRLKQAWCTCFVDPILAICVEIVFFDLREYIGYI